MTARPPPRRQVGTVRPHRRPHRPPPDTKQFGLAARGGEVAACRLAHHRGAIAVGDDQPRCFGTIALGFEDRRVEPRGERPIEAVEPVALIRTFAVDVRSEATRVGKDGISTLSYLLTPHT